MLWYRTTEHSGAAVPSWLDGLPPRGDLAVRNWQSRQGGEILVGYCETWREHPPAEAKWRDCDEGWQVIDWGPWQVVPLLREQHRLRLVDVHDGDGRLWKAPAVLHPYPLDSVSFDIPLGKDWLPDPTPTQSLLVNASRWAREEILRGVSMELEGRDIHEDVAITLPQQRAAMAVGDLLSAVYHLRPSVLQACRCVDKTLTLQVLMSAAGMNPEVLAKVHDAS